VEPHFRKQGVGKLLIEKALLLVAKNKVKEVQLNTYFKEAHDFFLACDFEGMAAILNWKYGLTCYLMRKRM
jgi:GNAT superfamily N-acetyltransferase